MSQKEISKSCEILRVTENGSHFCLDTFDYKDLGGLGERGEGRLGGEGGGGCG